MTEYDFNLQNVELPEPRSASRLPLAVTMMVFGLTLMGSVGFWQLNQASGRQAVASVQPPAAAAIAVNSAPDSQLGSPTKQRVAGLSTAQTAAAKSGFSQVDAVCSEQALFSIGQIETNPADQPVDEFNWAGAVDVLPESDQPFVIGQSPDARFAWRLSPEPPASQVITFAVTPEMVGAANLALSWSAGYSASQAIRIELDGQLQAITPVVESGRVAAGWQQLAFTQQQVPLQLTAGTHTLTLSADNPAGEAIVWDGLLLTLLRCP